MKSWAATAVLAVAAVALSVDIPGVGPKFQGAAAGPDGVAAKLAAEEIPEELRKKIEEMLAAMSADQMTARELDSKMANLKELMDQLDPAMQKKLAELLKKQPLGEDAQTKRRDLDEEDKAERAENSQAGLPEDVRWALEDLAARLASANVDRKTAEKNPSASSETGEKGKGSRRPRSRRRGQQRCRWCAKPRAIAGAAQMMGRRRARWAAIRGPAPAATPARRPGGCRERCCWRRRCARSSSKPTPTRWARTSRRKTFAARPSRASRRSDSARVAPLVTFDRSRAAAPPPVPEARRPLLLNYFIRKK